MINITLLLIFILVMFILINICKCTRKYVNEIVYLNKKLNNNGYKIDPETFSIYDKNNNLVKKYSTIFFNSKESNYIAKNKPLTNNILLKNNIPTPIHVIITNIIKRI